MTAIFKTVISPYLRNHLTDFDKCKIAAQFSVSCLHVLVTGWYCESVPGRCSKPG